MNIQHKDATITPTGDDDAFPGTFEVVLSTGAKDRDGDTLAPDEWKQPLPDHITFDADHGMSVATTVGSGVPALEDGKLIVRGTFSSLPRAQEVRTLVKEGHIRTTSVAFMSEKSTEKDATVSRELLNGAFVAIPSNREALVMGAKAGARNNSSDAAKIQQILELAMSLGAVAPEGQENEPADGKSAEASDVKSENDTADADASAAAEVKSAADQAADDASAAADDDSEVVDVQYRSLMAQIAAGTV